MSSSLSTGFPSAPFVDLATGNVTDVWRRYLLTLDARTGGRIGTDSASLEAQLKAEEAARIAADAAETTARIAADNAEAAARGTADSAGAAALTRERTARIAGDAALGVRIDTLVSAPSRLLVNGDVPVVGIICAPDGVPVYVA